MSSAKCTAVPAADFKTSGAGAKSQNDGATAPAPLLGQPMFGLSPRSGVSRFRLGCRVIISKMKHILGFCSSDYYNFF